MQAIEFNALITNGKMELPAFYKEGLEGKGVRVLLLCEDNALEPVDEEENRRKVARVKGILKERANPELIPLEKEAWGMAMREKHAIVN